MRVVLATLLAALAASCSNGSDAPKFAAGEKIDLVGVRIDGPVLVAPRGDTVAFVDSETGNVFVPPKAGPPPRIAQFRLADGARMRDVVFSTATNTLVGSYATDDGPIVVAERGPRTERSTSRVVAEFESRAGGTLAFDDKGVLIALDGRIVRRDGTVVSERWSGPVALAVDTTNRLWAVDAGGEGERARIARGRERNQAKRHRFATFLPAGARPVAAAADEDNVYVCDAATSSVLRFYIGLDDVARRRGAVPGMRCEDDIAVSRDGSIVTSVDGQLWRYESAD